MAFKSDILIFLLLISLTFENTFGILASPKNAKYRHDDEKHGLLNILAHNGKTVISNTKLSFSDDIIDKVLSKFNTFSNSLISTLEIFSSSSSFSQFNKNPTNLNPSQVASKLGIGFVVGYSSGFFMKRITNMFVFLVGGAVVSIQTLAYFGYITVDYHKIKKDVCHLFDLNEDGFADDKDIDVVYQKVQKVLLHNLPIGGGFSTGFYLAMLK